MFSQKWLYHHFKKGPLTSSDLIVLKSLPYYLFSYWPLSFPWHLATTYSCFPSDICHYIQARCLRPPPTSCFSPWVTSGKFKYRLVLWWCCGDVVAVLSRHVSKWIQILNPKQWSTGTAEHFIMRRHQLEKNTHTNTLSHLKRNKMFQPTQILIKILPMTMKNHYHSNKDLL